MININPGKLIESFTIICMNKESGKSRPVLASKYKYQKRAIIRVSSGNDIEMDYIDKALEKLKEWTRKLIEALLGPQPEPEPELIPIPVNDRSRR